MKTFSQIITCAISGRIVWFFILWNDILVRVKGCDTSTFFEVKISVFKNYRTSQQYELLLKILKPYNSWKLELISFSLNFPGFSLKLNFTIQLMFFTRLRWNSNETQERNRASVKIYISHPTTKLDYRNGISFSYLFTRTQWFFINLSMYV